MGFSSLSEYLLSLGERKKEYALRFISFMEKEYPNLKVRISFSMPMWWLKEKMKDGYVGISASKSRFTLHFSSEAFTRSVEKERPDLKYGKQCVSIGYKDEEDYRFIERKALSFLSSNDCPKPI